MVVVPEPRTIPLAELGIALREGVADFRATAALSFGYGLLFTLIGAALFALLEGVQVAPFSLSLAGGFMLIGPALLAGFFGLIDAHEAGRIPVVGDILGGFRRVPAGLWGLAVVCLLLFLIWLTDAATIYAFVIGHYPIGFAGLLPPIEAVARFAFFSSLMGLLLAFILFSISAFSVPLLIYRNPGLIAAVVASVRAVFRNRIVMIAWALLLVLLVMGAAWFLPLLPLTLPVCAFAGRRLYRRVFEAN